jgi:drug/metabolite transporter (DMT)-like permease
MLGAVVEAAVAIPSIISMGPEGGTILIALLNAVLCFPYAFILAFTMPETQTDLSAASVLLLAIFQFPAYALLGWLLKRIRPRWNGWSVLAVIHGVGVIAMVVAAFEFILSNFQT